MDMSLDGEEMDPSDTCQVQEDSLDDVEVHENVLFNQTYSELYTACKDGDLIAIQTILDGVPEEAAQRLINYRKKANDCDASMLVYTAILYEQLEILQYLASHRFTDLDQEGMPSLSNIKTSSTALMVTCHLDNYLFAKVLLENGANPNKSIDQVTPLIIACTEASSDLVEVLLKHGADPTLNPHTDIKHNTSLPFYLACLRGDLDIVQTLLVHLKNDEESLISLEQLVLCRTVLGLSLLKNPDDVSTGISFWQSSIREFRNIRRPRFGFMNLPELSRELHTMYLTESALVQSGTVLNLGENDMLKRTHSRFMDFKMCVNADDIGTVFQVDSDTTMLHAIIIRSFISSENPLWRNVYLTLKSSLREIERSTMSNENQRLCLLVILENALNLNQEWQILTTPFLHSLFHLVMTNRLFHRNPGYLMLLLDILNTTLKNVLSCFESGTAKLDISMSLQFTAELFAKFIYLILNNELNDFQKSHMAKLVSSYISLAKTAQKVIANTHMEVQILIVSVSLLCPGSLDFLSVLENDGRLEARVYELISSLLRCGANPNSRDVRGNTALLLCLGLEEPYMSETIKLFMAHGGHMDVANYSGNSPYQILCTLTESRIDPMQCRSLKCRAASTISFFKIPYRRLVPKDIEEFIQLHDTHTRTNLR